MTTKARELKAIARKEGKWWEISIPELDQVTATKRLSEVEEYAHGLAVAHLDCEPEDVHVTVDYRLPEPYAAQWEEAREQGRTAEAAVREAAVRSGAVVARLHESGWSDRDIAAATGLVYQRIHALRHHGSEPTA